jgi:basic membrane lipoprotein Med (substrate-binding protein (PBP1-ABC) superfamily)
VIFGVNVSNLAVSKAVSQYPGATFIGWNADQYLDPAFADYKALILASIQKSTSSELVALVQAAMDGKFASGLVTEAPDGTPLVALTNEHEVPFANGISSDLQNLKPTL